MNLDPCLAMNHGVHRWHLEVEEKWGLLWVYKSFQGVCLNCGREQKVFNRRRRKFLEKPRKVSKKWRPSRY